MVQQARTALHPTAASRAVASAEKKRRLLPTASRPQHQPCPSSSRDIISSSRRGEGRMGHHENLLRSSDVALQHRRSNSAASCTSSDCLLTDAGVHLSR